MKTKETPILLYEKECMFCNNGMLEFSHIDENYIGRWCETEIYVHKCTNKYCEYEEVFSRSYPYQGPKKEPMTDSNSLMNMDLSKPLTIIAFALFIILYGIIIYRELF